MKKIALLWLAALAAGCGYDDFDAAVPVADTVPLP